MSEELDVSSTGDEHIEPSGPALGAILVDFVRDIDALHSTLFDSMFTVAIMAGHAENQFKEFAEEFGEVSESNYKFPLAYGPEAVRRLKAAERAVRGIGLVPRSFVVSLSSTFDAFLGRLLIEIYLSRPELLQGSDRTVSISQLNALGSIEAASRYVIAKDIENLIRDSRAGQFQNLEKRFGLPLTKGLAVWPAFIELTERRHCLVHNAGRVSEQYLAVCRGYGVDTVGSLEIGDDLDISPEYFSEARDATLEVGIKLCQTLWRKLFPSELGACDAALTSVVYDMLLEKRWDFARKLLEFAVYELKKYGSDKDRRIHVINLAQALKWKGQPAECLKVIECEDWSACGQIFDLAVQVLKDEFDDACSTMRAIGPESHPSEWEYEDWPLFSEFREREVFLKTFEDIFGRSFQNVRATVRERESQKAKETLERFRRAWAAQDLATDEAVASSEEAI